MEGNYEVFQALAYVLINLSAPVKETKLEDFFHETLVGNFARQKVTLSKFELKESFVFIKLKPRSFT